MDRTKDLKRFLIQWVLEDRLSRLDPSPLPAPSPLIPARHKEALTLDGPTLTPLGRLRPGVCPATCRNPYQCLPRSCLPRARYTDWPRFAPPPPRMDPYMYPLCAMAFPHPIRCLLSPSLQYSRFSDMSNLRSRTV